MNPYDTIPMPAPPIAAEIVRPETLGPPETPGPPAYEPNENSLVQGYRHPNTTTTNSNTASLPSAGAGSATTGANSGLSLTPGLGGLAENGLRPASVINLSNSNDVVIGPMTQYQGAVTIYQYMDATVETSTRRGPISLGLKGNNTPDRLPNDDEKKCTIFDIHNLQTWLLIIVLIIIAGGVGIAIHLALLKNLADTDAGPRPPREIFFGNEYEDETIPNLGNGHLVIDRKQWGAATISPANALSLKHPIPQIIITHIGVQSNPCDNVYNCSIKMRTIQDSSIAEKKLNDLPANFYVSHDGYVYVGRGWNFQNAYTNHSLAICFMGDYIRFEPSDKQFDGVKYLLAYGVARSYITPDYLLIAHNQTKSTKSPGSYVYQEIVKWPHWYACGVHGKPKCDW